MCKMSWWRNFLDSLDTGGGHIFVLFVLIVIGIGVYARLDPTAGGQVITLAFGALLALTKTTSSNSDQVQKANGHTDVTISASSVKDEPPPTPPVLPVVPPVNP